MHSISHMPHDHDQHIMVRDGEIIENFKYHKEEQKQFNDIQPLRFVKPPRGLLPAKKGKTCRVGGWGGSTTHNFTHFQVLYISLWKWRRKMTHHSSHCQPFSEMFHASLSTDCKIRVTSCPSVLGEMIVDLQAEYRINVPMKHTTLRCYGLGRALYSAADNALWCRVAMWQHISTNLLLTKDN